MTSNREPLLTKVSYYKNVWQTISNHDVSVNDKNVIDVLSAAKSELIKGILIYNPYTIESFQEWKEKYSFKDVGLQRLVQMLSVSLNLHSCDMWNIFCNYLMFEYYGKISDMKRILKSTDYTNSFIENVWFFYTSERMYILKTVHYILENFHKTSSFNLYGKYVDVLIPDIYYSLLKQLSYLINEINFNTYMNCISMKEWIDRNIREQLEVVTLLTIAMKHIKLDMYQYVKMINVFKEYNFTKQPLHFEVVEIGNQNIIAAIKNAEIAACLVGLLHCWDNKKIWEPYIDFVESAIIPLFEEEDMAILTLAWTSLQMTLPRDIALNVYNTKYHRYVAYAFDHCVFHQMYEIITCDIIMKNEVGELIRKAMYKVLQQTCDKFDSNGEVYVSKSSCQLLSELIKEPSIATDCFIEEERGATSLYNTSLRVFPYDFSSVTYIYTSLLSYEQHRPKILEYLKNMPHYTEEYLIEHGRGVEQLTLNQNYEVQKADIVFPKGTQIVIWNLFDKALFTLKHPCNYFIIFKNLVNEVVVSETIDEINPESICSGYRLLLKILEIPETHSLREIQQCLGVVTSLLFKFTRNPFKDKTMVSMMFNVCVKLIQYFDDGMLPVLVLHNFLPTYLFQRYNLKSCQRKDSINVGTINEFILIERLANSYDIILNFLDLIEICIENGIQLQKVQFPCLIYMTIYIFTKYGNWVYTNDNDKHKIAGKCLNIYFLILQKNPHKLKYAIEKDMYNYCKASFMNNKCVMKTYLKVLRFSNTALNLQMHAETNWAGGKLQVFRNVKLALSIFLILSNDKKIYEETIVKCVFPNENERRNFLKVIAGYMHQPFDESIAELAVIILRKIAKVSGLPMYSSMDMDFYQIQGLFLYKLRDPLVTNELKIAIVEFIKTCLPTQHGLTAALFNLTYDQKGMSGTSGESVTQFLIEYLSNIEKSPQYLQSPLQASILNLLFHIWLYKKEVLIQDLTSQEVFWPTLIDPLVKTSNLPYEAYSQILNIVSIELLKCREKSNDNLKNTLKTIFSQTELFVTTWCTRLLSIIDESSEELEEDAPPVVLLRDWRNFIITSTKIFPDIYTDSEVQFCLIDSTVKGLIQHFKNPAAKQVIGIWIELYLYSINLWPETCRDFANVSFTSLISINKSFATYYPHFKKIIRATFMGAVKKTVMTVTPFLESKPDLFYEYLEPIGDIMNAEFKLLFLEENKKSRLVVRENDMTWVLLNHLIIYILKIDTVHTLANWFQYYKVLSLLLGSLRLFICRAETLHTAKAVVSCLTCFAEGPMAKFYLDIPLSHFYDSLAPPLNELNLDDIRSQKQFLWSYKEWWKIYRGIIEFSTVLLEKFGSFMIRNGFALMSLHLRIVKETFRLPSRTAELDALKLVCSLLNYCLSLLNWKQYWHLDNYICFQQVVDAVKVSFNACIAMILRPKIICFFIIDPEFEPQLVPPNYVSNKRLIDIMDLVIDIVSSCCKCFIKSSIHITKFLEYYGDDIANQMVETDFNVPKIQQDATRGVLTFGSLLCTLHFLCKCTTQINLYRYHPNNFEPINNNKGTNMKLGTFICTDGVIAHSFIDRFTAVQHFAASELSSMTASWLCHLNESKIQFALETLATFLAAEIYTTLHTDFAEPHVVYFIRRELYSELQMFHEFIRKKSLDLHLNKEKYTVTPKGSLDVIKYNMETSVADYLLTISQWFVYICDLFH